MTVSAVLEILVFSGGRRFQRASLPKYVRMSHIKIKIKGQKVACSPADWQPFVDTGTGIQSIATVRVGSSAPASHPFCIC